MAAAAAVGDDGGGAVGPAEDRGDQGAAGFQGQRLGGVGEDVGRLPAVDPRALEVAGLLALALPGPGRRRDEQEQHPAETFKGHPKLRP